MKALEKPYRVKYHAQKRAADLNRACGEERYEVIVSGYEMTDFFRPRSPLYKVAKIEKETS
jgi:hypothetical protein